MSAVRVCNTRFLYRESWKLMLMLIGKRVPVELKLYLLRSEIYLIIVYH